MLNLMVFVLFAGQDPVIKGRLAFLTGCHEVLPKLFELLVLDY